MSIQEDGWQFNVDLVHLYHNMMRITEQATGMSQSRLEILHELAHREEMSQAELEQHLGVEGAVITRIVKQLEAAGMVSRRPDPQDNRYTLVALTPEARRMQTGSEAMEFRQNFGAALMSGLDESERAQLLKLIKRVSENVSTFQQNKS